MKEVKKEVPAPDQNFLSRAERFNGNRNLPKKDAGETVGWRHTGGEGSTGPGGI